MSSGSGTSSNARTAFVAAVGIAVTAWSGYKVYTYYNTYNRRKELVREYCQKLLASPEQLQTLKQDFIQQLNGGLVADVQPTGKQMLMLPTFVTQLPTGLETGDVYAIDLGGTNFRVMHVELSEERSGVKSLSSHEVKIPEAVYTGTGAALFDFLAGELKAFIEQHEDSKGASGSGSSSGKGSLPVVGFCFSFPTEQSALNKGRLLDWTKGFDASGVVNEDPVALLNEALVRAGKPCRIAALLNDTVGVLAAHRYLDPTTSVGVIIGTGTNACYVEDASKVTKWAPGGAPLPAGTRTAINMEWGAFFSPALPRCDEDEQVDEQTLHTGKYLFEKLVSGMFLGEIARRILLKITAETQLMGDFGRDPDAARTLAALAMPDSFTSAHLSRVVSDNSSMLLETASVLSQAFNATPRLVPASARRVVREVCELVALRSAQLVAVALDAILTHTGWSAATSGPATIAFDGGVYEGFVPYRDMLAAYLTALRGPEDAAQLRLELSHDGSGFGAAVLAAAAVATPAPAPAAPVVPAVAPAVPRAAPAAAEATPAPAPAAAADASSPSKSSATATLRHTAQPFMPSSPGPAAAPAANGAEPTGNGVQANGNGAAEEGDDDEGDEAGGDGSPQTSPQKQASSGGGSAAGAKKRKKKNKKKSGSAAQAAGAAASQAN